ncbi:hypothetical protein AB4Z46_28930 [Variovorax sp. M-6]|uniref:hypothetical protein n=1 Tax=Variovorax sp. M-6 TaxID=3233041 RepID=UPI003F9765BB
MQISFDTATLTMAYEMGKPAPSGVVVNAVAQGQASAKLFVDVTTPTGQPDPNIENVQVAITGMSARMVVTPKAGLAPNVYKGTLIFRACPAAACAVNYAGSPWPVSYTLTVTTTYAKLDTSAFGTPRTMVYDPVRGDVYASYPTFASVGLSAIARFRWSGAGWTSSTLSIPGLYDIALASDASVLAATDSSNKVNLIDLASFRVKNSFVSGTGIANVGSYSEVGIAFTKDGKLWMPTGTSLDWHGLGFFDLRTSTFGGASPPCTNCFSGPFFAVSGDGSRLMITQSASISPRPPMLYMDLADGKIRTNPIGLTFFYSLTSLSDNGDRFLMGGHTVYDRSFGTVGTVPQPNEGIRAAQLSPDGRRAYVLSYAIEPGTASPPVVQVFDSSAAAGTQLNLPLVGTFTIPDWPGCQASAYPATCYQPRMRLTPDGNNLLLLGDKNLIIAPIPKALSGLAP